MIKLFGQTDRDFSSNGDVVIRPLKAKVYKSDNNDYYLELETSLDFVEYLTQGRILVANTPQGDEPFRIRNVQKSKNKITLKAKHVYYDSENHVIDNALVEYRTCSNAVNRLNSGAYPASPFSVSSDIESFNTYECIRKSLKSAFDDVLGLWGGHVVRSFWNVEFREKIGADNGITVEYRKNIEEITSEENWDEVCTTILPVGKNETMLNSIDESQSIYMMSETQYDIPYCKVVTFSQEDVLEDDYKVDGELDEESYLQALVVNLRNSAVEYMRTHALPKVNYTLKANLDYPCDIGDTIKVRDERLGVDVYTEVISYTYDCITNRYIEIEFGNFRKSLEKLIPQLTKQTVKDVKETQAIVESQIRQSYYRSEENLRRSEYNIWRILGNQATVKLMEDATCEVNELKPLTLALSYKTGASLIPEDGGITVGSGVTAIKVSAAVLMNPVEQSSKKVQIAKVDGEEVTVLATCERVLGEQGNLNISPALVQCAEGDKIRLMYLTDKADVIVKNQTYMTVEVVG